MLHILEKVSALLLNGGRTVPLSINEYSVCNITKQSSLAQLIQRTTLLVWDEAPMTHKHVAECINRTYGTSVLAISHSAARLWCLGVTFVKSYR